VSSLRHRVIGAVLALAAAFALTACGSKVDTGTNAGADNNGVYVSLDDVFYQLQVSRELNPFSPEDHGYLAGVGNHPPGAQQIWYGVFLRALNKSNQPRRTSDSFDIRDTQGKVYQPVPVDPATNQYAWTAQPLQPLGTEPAPDTTASFGPTQGALILFKLDNAVYANRPLTLEIHSGTKTATISLDL
jgi:hypothetical protein